MLLVYMRNKVSRTGFRVKSRFGALTFGASETSKWTYFSGIWPYKPGKSMSQTYIFIFFLNLGIITIYM